ncbi:MAG: hypothetical protein JSS78_09240 [Bacteroidetes bacterium]|nr:hypothetical protein [Bacteroidota bacterium]
MNHRFNEYNYGINEFNSIINNNCPIFDQTTECPIATIHRLPSSSFNMRFNIYLNLIFSFFLAAVFPLYGNAQTIRAKSSERLNRIYRHYNKVLSTSQRNYLKQVSDSTLVKVPKVVNDSINDLVNDRIRTVHDLADSMAFIQGDKLDQLDQHTAHLHIVNWFSNNLNYRGRKYDEDFNTIADNLQIGFVTPFNLEFYYARNNYFQPDDWFTENILGLTYSQNILKGLSADVAYEHWFINYGDAQTKRWLNNYLNGSLTYDNDFINFRTDYEFMWGSQITVQKKKYRAELKQLTNTLTGNWQKDHVFLALDHLSLQPAATVVFSNSALPPVVINAKKQPLTYDNGKFGLSDYEFSLGLEYGTRNVTIQPVYHYAFPVALLSTETGLSPFGYFTLQAEFMVFVKNNRKQVNRG